jgi:hypothetical protein
LFAWSDPRPPRPDKDKKKRTKNEDGTVTVSDGRLCLAEKVFQNIELLVHHTKDRQYFDNFAGS